MPVTDEILDALIQWESGGNPNRVGKAGEIGLAQIKPSTAAQYGVSAEALHHPEVNRMVARRYLNDLLNHYQGDISMALAAYNAGPTNVDRGLIPQSTRQYVSGILSRSEAGTRRSEFAALPASREAAPPPAPAQPWRVARPSPAVPAGLTALAARTAQPFAPPVRGRMAAPAGMPGLPLRAAGMIPAMAPGEPNLERATGLLEERMSLLLLRMGIPPQMANVVSGAYAGVYRTYPQAQLRLRQALQSLPPPERAVLTLISNDLPKLRQLLGTFRGLNG